VREDKDDDKLDSYSYTPDSYTPRNHTVLERDGGSSSGKSFLENYYTPPSAAKPIVLEDWEMDAQKEWRGRILDRRHDVDECKEYSPWSERKKSVIDDKTSLWSNIVAAESLRKFQESTQSFNKDIETKVQKSLNLISSPSAVGYLEEDRTPTVGGYSESKPESLVAASLIASISELRERWEKEVHSLGHGLDSKPSLDPKPSFNNSLYDGREFAQKMKKEAEERMERLKKTNREWATGYTEKGSWGAYLNPTNSKDLNKLEVERDRKMALLMNSPGFNYLWGSRPLDPGPIYSRDSLGNRWERTMHGMVNRGVY